MKKSLFYSYFRKLFTSPLLYLCTVAITLISLFRYLSEKIYYPNVVYMLDLLLDLDTYRKIIPFFAAIPFAANYCNEYLSGVSNFYILRSGIDNYINTNIIINVISAFFTTFAGSMLYILILSCNMPLYESIGNPTAAPYGVFLDKGFPMLYILIKVTIFSASISMWVISGVAFSALLPSPYIAICTPFIFTYIIEKITMNFPDMFNLWFLSLGRDVLKSRPIITFIYTIGVFLVLTLLFSKIFSYVAERRIHNEFH